MVEFNNYKNFKNYCLKIAHNKEIKLTIQDYEIIDNFEELLNFLAILIEQNKIEYNGDMLNKIADLFKKDEIKNVIYIMDYLTRKLSKFKNGEVDIYYIFTSLRTMLGVDIQFTDEFIRSADTEDIFYPSRLRVLEICEDTDVIYSISINGLNENKIPGVYFIYDNKGVIAYIGKSISCAINRSFSSVIERKLIDFFKIEIRAPKTKSDIAIYEAYYISKFKPYCNNDLVYEDETTLLLPELDVIKSFERDLKRDYTEFTYSYVQSKVYDIDFILPNLDKTIFTDNEQNRKLLESKGYLDKYSMRQNAYQASLNKIKVNGKLSVSDLKWSDITDDFN